MALNNRLIASAQPGEVLWDETVTGLHLRCFANRKSFYLYYRTKTKRERKPKIGDHGIIALDQARQAARAMLAEVAAGGDPVARRQEAASAPTVADLCDKYLRHIKDDPKDKKKPRSITEDERQVEKYVRPKFGRLRVAEVTREEHIEPFHRAMAGKPYQANRTLSLLSRMFNLAEKWEMRPAYSNPCRHVTHYPEAKRKRYMQANEAPRIAELLREYESRRPEAVLFLYLLILSGARPSEIAAARPEWIKPRPIGAVLELPDSKTGEKNVYLPPQVLALLERIPRRRGDTLLGIQSPKSLWEIIRKEAPTTLRMYDLRHTFASAALASGYSLAQVGELLGHASTQTTQRYAHLIDGKAQEATAVTANFLEDMMKPKIPA